MKTALGIVAVLFAIWLGWQLGSPGQRLYERAGAVGDAQKR